MRKSTIHIDRHFTVSEVDPRIYGSFIEHLGRAVYGGIYQPGSKASDEEGYRTDTLELIKNAEVPVVRYPGGNFVSDYHWEDGVGPVEKRPRRVDPAWHTIETNAFGLNEFMKWTKLADTKAMMSVNLGTRGPEEAKDLIEYCNVPGGTYLSDLRKSHGVSEPHDIKLWCLGNEMDGPWQMGHKTAYEYARVASEAGRLMKMVDPSIELVACGSSNSGMPTFGYWEDTVLSEAYDVVDYLSLHQYYGNESDDTPDFLANSARMDDFISRTVALCDAVQAKLKSNKKINLSFDEWNVWYHSKEQDEKLPWWVTAPHQLEDIYNLEDALLVGSMLITLLRHADRVKIACLAQLVNVIAPIMTDDDTAWAQTIYYPYALTSRMGRGTVLNTLVKSDSYETSFGDVPYLDAVVIDDEEHDTLTLFAVNKDLTDCNEVSVDLRQYEDYQIKQCITVTGDDLKAVNTAENAAIKPVELKDVSLCDGYLKAVLPSKSWNVIKLQKVDKRL